MRTAVLIDGSNFYFKLKDLSLQDQFKFDFSAFCKFISGEEPILCKYYIGAIKTDGTKKMNLLHATQQKLFSHLKKHGLTYELGYLLKSDGRFHEKGVDVHMAVDLLVSTYENQVDQIKLVSSDTDLIPAIKQVQKKGKKVEYVGFSHQPSVALVANCTSSRLLTKEDLQRFVL